MIPEPAPAVFRAYDKHRKPGERAARMADVVAYWLDTCSYVLTAGPAAPLSIPDNVLLPSEADVTQRQRLAAHEPLYLWRYPLAFRLQLWRGGWEIRVNPRLLADTGRDADYRQHYRRNQLRYLLQELVAHLQPLFLIGPARQPPLNASHALREFDRWSTLYVGASLYRRFSWESVLEKRQAQMFPLQGGLWAEMP
jgi:hypothetical protein